MLDGELLTLTGVTKVLPRVGGKRIHPSTIWRWCSDGQNGVKLRCVRLGRRVFVPREALAEFAHALGERDVERFVPPSTTRVTPPPRRRTTKQRQRDILRAERKLREFGL